MKIVLKDLRGRELYSHDCEDNTNLKTIRAAINKGICLMGADFRNMHLVGLTLQNVDLRTADFSGSNLANAIFNHCDLKYVKFNHCYLTCARFISCDIDEGEIKHTQAHSATFWSSSLNKSIWTNSTFIKSDVVKALPDGVIAENCVFRVDNSYSKEEDEYAQMFRPQSPLTI